MGKSKWNEKEVDDSNLVMGEGRARQGGVEGKTKQTTDDNDGDVMDGWRASGATKTETGNRTMG